MEIYSNCTGSFVLEDGKVVDSILFEDPLNSNLLLEKGEQTPEEQKLLKKHQGAKITRKHTLLASDLHKMREIAFIVTKEKLRLAVKTDWLIIQTAASLDELDKTINLLSKRLREWYELYNPEISHSIDNHERFVEVILEKSKKELLAELKIKNTMGADLAQDDLQAIMNLAKEINELFKFKKKQEAYLEEVMQKECPNIKAVAGTAIGSKLLTLAGSLERLAKFPASTIQILGAEKALFRHLINKGNRPPKYGILHEHSLVAKASMKNRGKVARVLGDKIAIAAKVDFFKGKFVGNILAKEIDKRIGELKK